LSWSNQTFLSYIYNFDLKITLGPYSKLNLTPPQKKSWFHWYILPPNSINYSIAIYIHLINNIWAKERFTFVHLLAIQRRKSSHFSQGVDRNVALLPQSMVDAGWEEARKEYVIQRLTKSMHFNRVILFL
jgi:hypothetical protein